MAIEITITAKSAKEVVALVQDLAEVLPGMDPEKIPASTKVSTIEETKPEPEPQPEPESNQEQQEEPAAAKDRIPDIVEIRKLAMEKGATPEGREAIKDLLKKFGCRNISSIPEEKRVAFLEGLEAI